MKTGTKLKLAWSVLGETFAKWNEHKAVRLVNPGLAFGAAGALVIILVWVNLVSLILLFGAEFIRVYSRRFGSHAQPKAYAEALTPEAKAIQGMPAK